MDSPRADLDLVIGYDFGGESYSAFCLMRRHQDGTLEIIEKEFPGPFNRGQLLNLCLTSIKRLKPNSVRVRVGQNEPILVTKQTVEEILGGTKGFDDLIIRS